MTENKNEEAVAPEAEATPAPEAEVAPAPEAEAAPDPTPEATPAPETAPAAAPAPEVAKKAGPTPAEAAEVAKQKAGKFFSDVMKQTKILEKKFDVESMKERAKEIDVSAIASQVKDRAGELSGGKTIEDVPARATMDEAVSKEALTKAEGELIETLSASAEALLNDIASGETFYCKMKCASEDDSSQIAVSDKNVYFFHKAGESNVSVRIISLKKVRNVQLTPPIENTAGIMVVNENAKFSISLKSTASYFKIALVCKKLLETA